MIDVDTCVTTRYVAVDECDKARGPQGEAGAVLQQRGPAPSLRRSEVATWAIFAQWGCFERERAFYRYATRHLRAAFPGLPARSQFNHLVRQVQDLLVAMGQWLAGQRASAGCASEVLESMALVTRNAKRRGDGWLVGQADLGWSNRMGCYEGLHLLTAVTARGVMTGDGCAPASTADQRLAETLLAARMRPQSRLPEVGRPLGGGSYLADTNFEGPLRGQTVGTARAPRLGCGGARSAEAAPTVPRPVATCPAAQTRRGTAPDRRNRACQAPEHLCLGPATAPYVSWPARTPGGDHHAAQFLLLAQPATRSPLVGVRRHAGLVAS